MYIILIRTVNLLPLNLWINSTNSYREKKVPIFSAKMLGYKVINFDYFTLQVNNLCPKYCINNVDLNYFMSPPDCEGYGTLYSRDSITKTTKT